jgi:hypothetical protein
MWIHLVHKIGRIIALTLIEENHLEKMVFSHRSKSVTVNKLYDKKWSVEKGFLATQDSAFLPPVDRDIFQSIASWSSLIMSQNLSWTIAQFMTNSVSNTVMITTLIGNAFSISKFTDKRNDNHQPNERKDGQFRWDWMNWWKNGRKKF